MAIFWENKEGSWDQFFPENADESVYLPLTEVFCWLESLKIFSKADGHGHVINGFSFNKWQFLTSDLNDRHYQPHQNNLQFSQKGNENQKLVSRGSFSLRNSGGGKWSC